MGRRVAGRRKRYGVNTAVSRCPLHGCKKFLFFPATYKLNKLFLLKFLPRFFQKAGNISIINLLVNIDVLCVRAADAVRKLGGKYNIQAPRKHSGVTIKRRADTHRQLPERKRNVSSALTYGVQHKRRRDTRPARRELDHIAFYGLLARPRANPYRAERDYTLRPHIIGIVFYHLVAR